MNGTNYELIVKPTPLHIIIPFWPKYSSQDPVCKYSYPAFLSYCKIPCLKALYY